MGKARPGAEEEISIQDLGNHVLGRVQHVLVGRRRATRLVGRHWLGDVVGRGGRVG